MGVEYREGSAVYPAGHEQIGGEENVHGTGSAYRKPPIKSVTAGHASGGGGAPHGFGHKGAQVKGVMRLSGHKGAHRLGAKRGK